MRSQHFRSGAHYISFSATGPGVRIRTAADTPAATTTLPDEPHKDEFRRLAADTDEGPLDNAKS